MAMAISKPVATGSNTDRNILAWPLTCHNDLADDSSAVRAGKLTHRALMSVPSWYVSNAPVYANTVM